uniref:Uncharacterized protein LOC104225933 n=1 Tax=Nicotiana sylvestris TaxID=4096 RepID=A0A1U7WFT1_NICSY|nr:PREDICTED: uncharacterized protein LOC104225933 [Nicotiana sylvestris]
MEFTLHQMDVKSSFLNGYLKEEVFVKQPPRFESKECPDHMYKLDKALYGLKQAPKVWYKRLSKFLREHGYKRGKIDNTLFLKGKETSESRKRGGKNKKVKEKESEGVRSGERGMGKRVVDSSPTSDKGRMAICGAESNKVEENLLKKVGDSYNPKKKRTSKAKTSGTARANKKRKAAPSDY